MAVKDWDVVRDSEEYETYRKSLMGLTLTRQERGRLGGLSTRQKHGYQHYRDAARKRWGK